MDRHDPIVFSLDATRPFGRHVADALGVPLSRHEEREFEDGEHKSRPLVNIRRRDVYVIQSLYADEKQSVNDKLCRLLFFLGAVRDASAASVTAVVPYLCYSRKDRKSKSRDPVTTRYVARLFEAVGTDRVVTMDVHNLAAFQNAFAIRTDHLDARTLFLKHFVALAQKFELTLVSPDLGGMKRVRAVQESLSRELKRSVAAAVVEKERSAGIVSGEAFIGETAGRAAIIIDDLISSGTTLARAAQACRERGAARVLAAATHGMFVADAERVLKEAKLDRILVTNTISPFRLSQEFAEGMLETIDVAPLFAKAIERIHSGGSLVELVEA